MTAPRPAEEPVEDHIRRALRLMMAMIDAGKCEIRPTEPDDGVGVAWIRVMDAASVASDCLAAVERERDEARASASMLADTCHAWARMHAEAMTRAEAAEARLAAARAWLARVEPYPERNGDHFRELREILTADAPVPPQPELSAFVKRAIETRDVGVELPEPERCEHGYTEAHLRITTRGFITCRPGPVSPQSTEETL